MFFHEKVFMGDYGLVCSLSQRTHLQFTKSHQCLNPKELQWEHFRPCSSAGQGAALRGRRTSPATFSAPALNLGPKGGDLDSAVGSRAKGVVDPFG